MCAPSGRGRTNAQERVEERSLAGKGIAARLRLNDFVPDRGKGGSDKDAESATRRDAINPAHPCGVPRRFAVSFGQGLTAPLCAAS